MSLTLIRRVFGNKPHFCAGKFDRLKPAEAFPTIVSLLHDMCETIEASSEDVTGLSADAVATLMRLYPDVDSVVANENLQLLGEEPAVVPKDCNLEWSYEKLKQAFVSFVKATTEALDDPLILFLDDLHWMLPDTLGVVEALLQSLPHRVFFVGSYRDNDVDEQSPLGQLMQRYENSPTGNSIEFLDSSRRCPSHVDVASLNLQNLTLQDTSELIASAVNSSSDSLDVVVLSER